MANRRSLRISILAATLAALLFAVALAHSHAAVGQAAPATAQSAFEPFPRWTAAVVSGDRLSLAQFYSVTPPAQTKTSDGTSTDPSAEPSFWAGIASRRLTDMNAKVLEIERPNPNVVSLVLRIEFSLDEQGAKKPYVVEAAQVWVKEGADWKIAITQRSPLTARPVERLPEPTTPNVDLYPPVASAPEEIQNALAAASKDHKRVILVFGGNWCYDCHVLDAAFRSASIAPIVNANYHVAHINIGNMDTNLDIAKKYGVPIDKGVPALAVLDSNGSVIFSQKQGEFESSLSLAPQDVTAFLEKWKPAR